MKLTPNDMDVLLHHYITLERHERYDAPAVKDTIERFLQDGIFEEDDMTKSGYAVSEKGSAWIDMILSTPYPQHLWIDPRIKQK